MADTALKKRSAGLPSGVVQQYVPPVTFWASPLTAYTGLDANIDIWSRMGAEIAGKHCVLPVSNRNEHPGSWWYTL